MKDAIAYLAWERIVPWKVLSMMVHPDRPLVPVGFGSRNRDFPKVLEPGSRIWVVTRVLGEFSLAGRVVVQEVLDRKRLPAHRPPKDLASLFEQWRFVARADLDRSEFFETNDAEPVMAEHQVRFAQNRPIVYRDGPLDSSFQPCMDQACKLVFLSYRWKEARRFAIALARELRRHGCSPWLDAFSLGDYKPRRDPGMDAPRLQKLIRSGIGKSRIAVVINTATYGKRFWTWIELNHIGAKSIPWYQVMRGGTRINVSELPIDCRRPEEIVQKILQGEGRFNFSLAELAKKKDW